MAREDWNPQIAFVDNGPNSFAEFEFRRDSGFLEFASYEPTLRGALLSSSKASIVLYGRLVTEKLD